MNIRNTILNHSLPAETVDIPGLDVKVEVRARTVKQQYELLEKARKSNGEIDSMLLAVETIIACVYDPDSGDPVFQSADRDALLNMDSAPFNALLGAANDAAGLGEDIDVTAARLKETSPDANSSS